MSDAREFTLQLTVKFIVANLTNVNQPFKPVANVNQPFNGLHGNFGEIIQ